MSTWGDTHAIRFPWSSHSRPRGAKNSVYLSSSDSTVLCTCGRLSTVASGGVNAFFFWGRRRSWYSETLLSFFSS